MNRIEEKSRVLYIGERKLEPISKDRNMVGFCSRCDAELFSLAYHSTEISWLVCASCSNDHIVLMRYDRGWRWLEDCSLEIFREDSDISSISKEKLEAVFTKAEIRDMMACQSRQPYTKQNLYRARAKYEKFERLFGVKINI
ncbi:MAG: hypothetical protein MUE87_03030 [Methanothrix sp.]|jgi:NMD protein affecting ribosome stability and mRNA decay|nr:hypothetical protein [Methanothrix sp.]